MNRRNGARFAIVCVSIALTAAAATGVSRATAAKRERAHMTRPEPQGYLARPPAGREPRPAVLVLHPWWGLNETTKAFCRRLADAGHLVFAPDLYGGRVATTIAEAESLSQALSATECRAEVARALDHLAAQVPKNGRGIGVVGFSMGAFFALDLSAAAPERVSRVVIFYGTGPADFGRATAAYLGHFAERDPYEPEEGVAGLEDTLRQAGRPVTFHRYPGTGHWFFEPDRRDAYDEAAATLAWARTLAFLKD